MAIEIFKAKEKDGVTEQVGPKVEVKLNNSNISIPKENPKKIFISIDTSIQDIVKYQEEGCTLFFEDSKDKFKEFTDDEVKELNMYNRQKYNLAYSIVHNTLKLDEVKDQHKFFKPRAGFASATDRLEIRGGDPNMHRFWKRPDELQKVAYEGGRVCKDPNVVTFGGVDMNGKSLSGSSVHEVSANGEVELVLCETSKESNDARTKAIEAKSQSRNAAVDEAARTEIAKLGGATKDFG